MESKTFSLEQWHEHVNSYFKTLPPESEIFYPRRFVNANGGYYYEISKGVFTGEGGYKMFCEALEKRMSNP